MATDQEGPRALPHPQSSSARWGWDRINSKRYKSLFFACKRALQACNGIGVVTPCPVEHGEVVEDVGGVGIENQARSNSLAASSGRPLSRRALPRLKCTR